MARKSRKADFVNQPIATKEDAIISDLKPLENFAVYRAGLYARLSFESEDDKSRGTVETQMELCRRFVETQEDIVIQKEYYDISETGTKFDRPGFEEMMEDAKKGVINCIIVKDLSRLGRDYVEAGNYVERIFPFYDIRFIAITDNYDSTKTCEPILLGVSNIFNEMYVHDLSKKVRAGYRAAWGRGQCVAGKLPYGYIRNPENPEEMIIDEEAAEAVKLIFNLVIESKIYADIIRILKERKIISPSALRDMRRGVEVENRYNWTKQTIGHIIENQAYCGDGVHNRFYSSRIKKKIQRENPKEEWIIVPNEHPAIITKAVFDQANAERVRRIEIKNNHKNPGMYSARELNFLKGKIFCADCGGVMYLERHNHLVRYVCGNHHLKKNCFPHHIPDAKIKDEVLRVIHTHINVYTDNTAMIRRLNSKKSCAMKFDILGKEVNRIQADLTKVEKHKVGLYEDYTERILDAEQYLAFKALDEKKERDLQLKLESILSEKKQYDINFKSDKEWDDLINSIRDKRLLTKKMVDALVKRVEVDGKGNIIVELVYDDMLQDLVKYARGREAIDEK